jgi:uncharacterized damage-inducible protein DinB
MNSAIANEFIKEALNKLNQNTPKTEKCLHNLTEEDVWKHPNNSSNSVGNIILHLCGNIRQYIISSVGGKEDIRKHDEEFSTKGGYTKAELFDMLMKTINEASTVISNCTDEELLRVRTVQGFEKSGISVIMQVVEHYSYHTGQIIFWTKLLKDMDLAFYAGLELNKKNKV